MSSDEDQPHVPDEDQPQVPANPSWIWSGVHGASGIVHPFLATRNDPNRRYSGIGVYFDNVKTILAGSGGLLLIKRSPPDTVALGEKGDIKLRTLSAHLRGRTIVSTEPEPDDQSSDAESEIDDEANDTEAEPDTPDSDQMQSSLELDQGWQTLLVVNPTTHECRVLPPANSMEIGLEFWSYDGVQANLLVDTEFRTYTVTLTFPDCVCLYYSTSNAWECQRFIEGAAWVPRTRELLPNPWGPPNRDVSANPWQMQIASAYVNGRLVFADVVVDEDDIPTMNLIEVEDEVGFWILHNWWRCSLQTHFTDFVDTRLLRTRELTDHGMRQALNTITVASHRRGRVLENFQIVECMGELYAVIPMSLREYLPMSLWSRMTMAEAVLEHDNSGLSFMPMQFLIVNMRGGGLVHGVLRILVPEDVDTVVRSEPGLDYETRQKMLMQMLQMEADDGKIWGFACVGEGSVIWVSLLDYVLQYDVVTGLSETEIIVPSSPETSLELGLNRIPYRPSDMKP